MQLGPCAKGLSFMRDAAKSWFMKPIKLRQGRTRLSALGSMILFLALSFCSGARAAEQPGVVEVDFGKMPDSLEIK